MQELTLQNVSSDIQGFISSYTEDSRVKRIGLFGSVSRGEQHSDSDIDIITEYDYDGVFRMDDYIKYCIFCNALRETFEAMYARKVEVVDQGELFNEDNLYNDEVKREVIWIYDGK